MTRLFTLLLISLATSAFAVEPPAFVRIGGITGESQDPDHRKWFELVSFDQGPFRWTKRTVSGNYLPHESGTEGQGKLTVTRMAKQAAPDVYRAALNGTYFGTVRVDVPMHTGMGNKYIKWTLSDVVITEVNVKRPHEKRGVPIEQITFSFQRAEWTRPNVQVEKLPLSPQRMHVPYRR